MADCNLNISITEDEEKEPHSCYSENRKEDKNDIGHDGRTDIERSDSSSCHQEYVSLVSKEDQSETKEAMRSSKETEASTVPHCNEEDSCADYYKNNTDINYIPPPYSTYCPPSDHSFIDVKGQPPPPPYSTGSTCCNMGDKQSQPDDTCLNNTYSNDTTLVDIKVKNKRGAVSLYERAGWQLFAICYLVGVQSSLTTGFVNSCYSTLEKLFNFNSKFTGLIEGSFHVAIVLLVIPVSFYGRKGNKPLIMASGAALIAIGAFCYASAEFFRDHPFSVLNITTSRAPNSGSVPALYSDHKGCVTNNGGGSSPTSDDQNSNSAAKWLFVTGMFLIGIGSTPIQTVAIAYLDQGNKHEENTGWSLGWFHAIGLLAPALGFVLSGSFLSMPIDFTSWGMSTEDDSFMGAWWMGFMLECALALILVPILLTLPNTKSDQVILDNCDSKTTSKSVAMTNSKPVTSKESSQKENVGCSNNKECHCEVVTSSIKSSPTTVKDGAESQASTSVAGPQIGHSSNRTIERKKDEWLEFRSCVRSLMRDKTFLCLLLHGSVLHLTTAGLTAFIPKFFETQYRMIAQIAAFVAGGVSVPAAAIGAIISGYLIKRLQLDCLGTIKMTFWAQGSCIILCTVFFIIRCPYGHVYMWDETEQFQEMSGIKVSTDVCDGSEMRIHCVNQQYNIYSPCILDCMQQASSCSAQNVTMELGLCEPGGCQWRVPAFAIFFITFLVASMVAVPRIFALLRLVQDDWKTISLGIQWVFFRLLGMIPGPLVYGQIFDSACTQWGSFSMTCADAHSAGGGGGKSGHCSFYNSATLRNNMIIATVGSLIIGEICLFFAIYFYKQEHQGPGKKSYICAASDNELVAVVYFQEGSQSANTHQLVAPESRFFKNEKPTKEKSEENNNDENLEFGANK